MIPDGGWFERPVVDIARDMLGGYFTHRTPEGAVTIRIVEVEAYDGEIDPGSHAFRGLTQRNRTMFGPPGHLYVYRHLGLHTCANIVCGPKGRAAAVLLRAGEVLNVSRETNPSVVRAEYARTPVETTENSLPLARARRNATGITRSDIDLAQGPARLTVALGISITDDGASILDPNGPFTLRLATQNTEHIMSGPRVGVSGEGGRADLFPWRFWLADDPHVSTYRPAQLRKRKSSRNL